MPQKVTLEHEGTTETVIVETTTFHETGTVSLTGCDPSLYPARFRDSIRFFSKDLTALIQPEDDITVVSAAPTDEPVPEPTPSF